MADGLIAVVAAVFGALGKAAYDRLARYVRWVQGEFQSWELDADPLGPEDIGA